MVKKLRFVQIGLGAIGSTLCKVAVENEGFEIVGAIDLTNIGKDVGEIIGLGRKLGVRISNDINAALAAKPDIILHSTVSLLREVKDQLIPFIKAGVNIVSTCEELVYPWDKESFIATELDSLAKENKITVLATGVNPGFCMDTFPIMLTGVCKSVEKIKVVRIQDASHRRLPFQKKIGAGCTLAEFNELKASGKGRHVGLEESAGMIAAAMGWRIEQFIETIEPIVSERDVSSDYLMVKVGQVSGIEQVAIAEVNGREVIRLEFRAFLGAPDPCDTIYITGTPNMEVTVKGGIQGDIATVAMVVNAMPRVINAPAGLLTMKDLPLVHASAGNWGRLIEGSCLVI